MDFKAPLELWSPLSKAVPCKIHGSGGHSKHNWASFHRSRAWQIVLILNTFSTPNSDKNWGLINSLNPGRCGDNFKTVIIMQNSNVGTYSEIVVRWTPQNLSNDKSTLVLVMAWCHHVWLTGPCLPQGRISTPCTTSVLQHDRKSAYGFMFP